jgi:hypothetical protein
MSLIFQSQLLLNITTMLTSPLLHTFKSLAHQQKTYKETVTLEHHTKYLDREYCGLQGNKSHTMPTSLLYSSGILNVNSHQTAVYTENLLSY